MPVGVNTCSNCHSQGCKGNKHIRLAQAQQGQSANWTATGAATPLTFRGRRHEVLKGAITLVFCCKLIYFKGIVWIILRGAVLIHSQRITYSRLWSSCSTTMEFTQCAMDGGSSETYFNDLKKDTPKKICNSISVCYIKNIFTTLPRHRHPFMKGH